MGAKSKPDAQQDLLDRLATVETALGSAIAEIGEHLQELEDRLDALTIHMKREAKLVTKEE
jgi:hypothetical protein